MFENDEFDSEIATLPPDTYGISGAETTQLLYYPEFLPDANRPDWLEGSGRIGRITGANMLNGSIRYGDLLEVSLYDCRRNIDYKEQHAKVVTQSVEEWLMERTLAEDTLHYFHAPSLPFGYSSGKLGDWYPDVLDNDTGKLVLYQPKAGWQWGWFAQHQRLTQALASQKKRAPVVVQGDLHASSAGKILRSGEILYETPIHLILSGPLGTGDYAFPSSARDVESSPSQLVDMDEILKPLEKNGFSIIDVTENEMRFSLYTWRPPQAVEDISTMEPTVVYTVPRPS
ncbi:hypothetical protein [Moorena producens]|uniref:hypothetical protein n=1 Tax=Moorena producens TaxID=1155739 RepID=UPI003C7815F4